MSTMTSMEPSYPFDTLVGRLMMDRKAWDCSDKQFYVELDENLARLRDDLVKRRAQELKERKLG